MIICRRTLTSCPSRSRGRLFVRRWRSEFSLVSIMQVRDSAAQSGWSVISWRNNNIVDVYGMQYNGHEDVRS